MSNKTAYKDIIERGDANMQVGNFASASIEFYRALDIAKEEKYPVGVLLDCLERLSEALMASGRTFRKAADEADLHGHYESGSKYNKAATRLFEEAAQVNYYIGYMATKTMSKAFSLN